MRVITTAAPPDCRRCRGAGLVRPEDGGGGWVNCPACRGGRKERLIPPFTLAWVSGDDEAGEPVAVEFLSEPVPDRETAVARALACDRAMGPEYAGGRVVVSDARGVETFGIECRAAGKAVRS